MPLHEMVTTSRDPMQYRLCRRCGAMCRPERGVCWSCGEDPRAAFPPVAQFSVQSVLLATTLAAVCLAVWRWSPTACVFLLVLLVPALARTILGVALQRWRTPRLTFREKCRMFFLSLLITWTATAAGVTAFFVIYFGIVALAWFLGTPPGLTAYAAGFGSTSSALAITGWLLWISRPDRYGNPI
jgi:hypothetical protein